MMYWLPLVASPIGFHSHGGGGTLIGTTVLPLAPHAPVWVTNFQTLTEQSEPVQPTPVPATAGGVAAASGTSRPAMAAAPANITLRFMACTPAPVDSRRW